MPSYSVNDVERVLHLTRSTIRGLIDAGFVNPQRGVRREFRFTFRDMIVMRTARALIDAKVPRRRIRDSLEDLREHLPEAMPLSGLSICAVGDRVVVRDGNHRWQADNGQYLLGLDVREENGTLRVVQHLQCAARRSAPHIEVDSKTADQWFAEALHLEQADLGSACAAYERAVSVDSHHTASWINWGRLLHERGATQEADTVYRRAINECGMDALLLFNRGVLLEDLGDRRAAFEAYHAAIEEDPDLADCHYNLARLYQAMGQPQHAIRHFGQYRRLVSGPGN
jgi:predicted Zn-dependent protease